MLTLQQRQAREKNIIESTSTGKPAIIVGIMGKSIRKYQIRDRGNRYKRIEKLKLEDRYYTDVAKSHERKIKRKGVLEEPEDDRYK
jgi:hypothetical protein